MTIQATIARSLNAAFRRLVGVLRSTWAALGILTGFALVLAALMLALFGVLATLVSWGEVDSLDTRLLLLVASHRTPELTALMRGLSFLGSAVFGIPFALAVAGYLVSRRRRRAALFYLWVSASGWALNGLAKLLFHRSRPLGVERLSHVEWYSFPSGHAMVAPLVLGLGTLLLLRLQPRRVRAAGLAAVSVVILGIAVSRVYLGVHYPSDVVGALLGGTGWGALWVYATERNKKFPSRRTDIGAALEQD